MYNAKSVSIVIFKILAYFSYFVNSKIEIKKIQSHFWLCI